MKQTQANYNVGIYCRLSRDDGSGESASIGSQKLMLTEHVNAQGWRIVDYFCDDGWSGVNFDRPEFNRMIDEIEAGNINLVICKDLSRLGRNYIMAGQFSEVYFPSKGVRFIALTDGFDTDNENNDIAPFKHLLNDMYARDTSRKIRSVRKAKANAGQYVATFAPYGYKKAEDDHNRLVVNEETAPVVRRIYDMYVQGLGISKIRNILTEDRILTPAAYTNSKNPQHYAHVFDGCDEVKRYNWYASSVREILGNPIYIGHLVTGKYVSKSFKSKRKKVDVEDRVITENAFEPLIDQGTWEIVNEMLKTKRREMKEDRRDLGLVNEFAGVIKCADCGRALVHRTQTKQCKTHLRITRSYICNRYLLNAVHQCTFHYIRYDSMYQLILQSIQKYAAMSKGDKEAMAKLLCEAGNHQQAYETSQVKKELKSAQKRLSELERLVMRLYEEYIAGSMSGGNYTMLMGKYQAEQEELRCKADALAAVLAKSTDDAKNTGEFIEMIERYANVETLTPEIVAQLIEKIAVHEAQTMDGVKTQQVDIYWRFVGKLDL